VSIISNFSTPGFIGDDFQSSPECMLKPVMDNPRLNAKAAHPATLQYVCTVLKTGGNECFLMILMAEGRTRGDGYA
jgi:hypothetical protein